MWRWLRTFFCRWLKNDSMAALSAAAPTRPIEPTIRWRVNARWYFLERNWVGSTGRRNTLILEVFRGGDGGLEQDDR